MFILMVSKMAARKRREAETYQSGKSRKVGIETLVAKSGGAIKFVKEGHGDKSG